MGPRRGKAAEGLSSHNVLMRNRQAVILSLARSVTLNATRSGQLRSQATVADKNNHIKCDTMPPGTSVIITTTKRSYEK